MKNNKTIIISSIMLMFLSDICISADFNINRIEMKNQEKNDKKIPNVFAFIEASSEQLAKKGIEICIEIYNDAIDMLTITNPLDYMQIILEQNGKQVKLPDDGIPRGIIDSLTPRPRFYTITHLQIINAKGTVSEFPIKDTDVKQVSIAAKSRYRIKITLDKIALKQDASEVFVMPLSGSYRICINLFLHSGKKDANLFVVEGINIKLVENSDMLQNKEPNNSSKLDNSAQQIDDKQSELLQIHQSILYVVVVITLILLLMAVRNKFAKVQKQSEGKK